MYLGIGNGERFRWLRDEFFPALCVVGFDPLDPFYTGKREDVWESARQWNQDGSDFAFFVRCFYPEDLCFLFVLLFFTCRLIDIGPLYISSLGSKEALSPTARLKHPHIRVQPYP